MWTILVVPFPLREVYGYANREWKTIIVDGTLPPEQFADTILHECHHALDWRASETKVRNRGQKLARVLSALGCKI